MSAYKITELQNAASHRNGKIVEARDLSAAKRKASRMQMFQGTVMEVATVDGVILSVKKEGEWNDRQTWPTRWGDE